MKIQLKSGILFGILHDNGTSDFSASAVRIEFGRLQVGYIVYGSCELSGIGHFSDIFVQRLVSTHPQPTPSPLSGMLAKQDLILHLAEEQERRKVGYHSSATATVSFFATL